MLPNDLPIFPLEGVLLLPRGELPLNIFEPRYLAMVDHAFKTDRLIGMIQPKKENEFYGIGCAGRVTSFEEAPDGRYLIGLTGICRFELKEELPKHTEGFRRVTPDWSAYKKDLDPVNCLDLDRSKLIDMLRQFFDMHDLTCDWDAIKQAPDERLITCLSMICPFDPKEKQALLEAACCNERANLFMTILEMSLHEQGRIAH